MHIEYTDRPRRRKPSLTPLIDVVFILLVFFMLASSFTEWRSLQLGIPGEASSPTEDEMPPLIVRVAPDSLELDGEAMAIAAVAERVAAAVADEPERIVIVRPGDGVALQRVVTVMERLSAAGGSRISLQREE